MPEKTGVMKRMSRHPWNLLLSQQPSYRQLDPGIDAFIAAIRRESERHQLERPVGTDHSSQKFILRISEDFAFIRLADLRHPLRFLRQVSGDPPVQFGIGGFRSDIVDDRNPARHYVAFVFVGYWLPMIFGYPVLIAWEVLGFLRYGLRWSQNDLRCGLIGLRHGRAVRREGSMVLAGLIERDLKEHQNQ